MKKWQFLFALSVFLIFSGCSSTPEKSPGSGGDEEVNVDTAPGLGGGNQPQGEVEVISAEPKETKAKEEDISSESKPVGQMDMVDVNTIYEPLIYFGYNQHELTQEGVDNARYHADILIANPSKTVVLAGHTDERGSSEYNLALAEKRANFVAQALMLFGVQENRIEVISIGEEQPADAASNALAWQKNRRVEITIK